MKKFFIYSWDLFLGLNRGRYDSRFAWLPLTTGYQNFRPRVFIVYHWLPLFQDQTGYRLPVANFTIQTGYHTNMVVKFKFKLNRYKRGLDTCPQANLHQSGRKYFRHRHFPVFLFNFNFLHHCS